LSVDAKGVVRNDRQFYNCGRTCSYFFIGRGFFKSTEVFNKIYNIEFENPGTGTIEDVLNNMKMRV